LRSVFTQVLDGGKAGNRALAHGDRDLQRAAGAVPRGG